MKTRKQLDPLYTFGLFTIQAKLTRDASRGVVTDLGL